MSFRIIAADIPRHDEHLGHGFLVALVAMTLAAFVLALAPLPPPSRSLDLAFARHLARNATVAKEGAAVLRFAGAGDVDAPAVAAPAVDAPRPSAPSPVDAAGRSAVSRPAADAADAVAAVAAAHDDDVTVDYAGKAPGRARDAREAAAADGVRPHAGAPEQTPPQSAARAVLPASAAVAVHDGSDALDGTADSLEWICIHPSRSFCAALERAVRACTSERTWGGVFATQTSADVGLSKDEGDPAVGPCIERGLLGHTGMLESAENATAEVGALFFFEPR